MVVGGKVRFLAVVLVLALLAVPGQALQGSVSERSVAGQTGQTGMVSLIVSKTGGARAVEEGAEILGARITARWPFINAFAADVPAYRVRRIAGLPGVRSVTAEARVRPTMVSAVSDSNLWNTYNYAVRADRMWTQGYDGSGITVAVVDSGFDMKSPDIAPQTITSVRFNDSTPDALDRYGHGTHVAGILAGNGNASNGKFVGIAPGVNLVNIKYGGDDGTARERNLVDALQWIYQNQTRYNIRVVNISATVDRASSYKESPVSAAVEQLWFSGIVVVVAAGNRGSSACSVCYAPASDPYVITVGAVDDGGSRGLSDDYMKEWSSYGRTMDGHFKPDVMAPGARIISYGADGVLKNLYPSNGVHKDYLRLGGTSMSAPIVSGVVALMLQADPDLMPDQVKWLLMGTTRSYKQQIPGTPGIIQADAAGLYSGSIGLANQGLTPSPMLTGSNLTVDYSNALWANALWANALWAFSPDY